MFDAILNGLSGLGAGVVSLHWSNPIMIAVGCLLLYLGIKKDVEPLLLVPIGFGAILVNIPLADLMGEEGFLPDQADCQQVRDGGVGRAVEFGLPEQPARMLRPAAKIDQQPVECRLCSVLADAQPLSRPQQRAFRRVGCCGNM